MANKYLDGAGLDHMWDKVKAYLTNNYAAKSHMHTITQITDLQTTLNGKANSSHTHTSSQITDLSSKLGSYVVKRASMYKNVYTNSSPSNPGTITLPSMSVSELLFFDVQVYAAYTNRYIKAPSGGTYSMLLLGIETTTGRSNAEAGVSDINGGANIFYQKSSNAYDTIRATGIILRKS